MEIRECFKQTMYPSKEMVWLKTFKKRFIGTIKLQNGKNPTLDEIIKTCSEESVKKENTIKIGFQYQKKKEKKQWKA